MRELTIKRTEGNFYICEDKDAKQYAIDMKEMVEGVKTNDIIIIDNDGNIKLK